MAVEKEVEVEVEIVMSCSEDVKEVLSKHGNSEPIVGEDANGGSNEVGSNCSEKVEVAKDENNDVGFGTDESKTNSNSSEEVEQVKNKIRIMVSGRKKPFFFYINLAKKYLSRSYDVELSGLGLAIPTVITISEFLKRHGLAAEKNIRISTITNANEENSRTIVKAQIEILLGSSDSTGNGLVVS